MSPILGVLASGITKSKTIVGAYESIATVTTTAGASSVLFSSIPQTYQSLQIRYFARKNAGGTFQLGIKPNQDTGATNKAYHLLNTEGAGVVDAAGGSATSIILMPYAANADDPANIYGVGIIDIHDYTNTTRNKTIRAFGGYDANGSGRVGLFSGFLISTSALTSIEITGAGDNFAAGCVLSLYGIKGA